MTADSDKKEETPVSAYAQYDVRVLEGDKLIQSEDGSQGYHLFRLSGQVAPSFSFTNTDPYRYGVFMFSFGPTVLGRATVAPGETHTLTSEQMEAFRLSPGERVYGNLTVSVKWAIHLHEDQKQRDVLARAVTKFVEYYSGDTFDQAGAAEAVVSALERHHARRRHVIMNLVFANQAGLAFTSDDYRLVLEKIMNEDSVPKSLEELFSHGGILIDSASPLDLLGSRDFLRDVSYQA